MYWPKVTIDGTEYDLSHLDPYSIEVSPAAPDAPTFKVGVSFGCHTFTRERQDGDPISHHFEHRGDVRTFCPKRYELSKLLPELIGNQIGRVYFSHDSYLIAYALDGLAYPYVVVFKMSKAKIPDLDTRMFVTTAHEKSSMASKSPAITFATLVDSTAKGRRITQPRERRSITLIKK
ncbi:hypothetical protein [Methyloceanibacter sp. wino2]|uniref:hypothetical protein n=1 Tax=Methyloceanibacter sp. wino2 TaxID=2170729 RepID=UPI00131F39AE|nr:hypothetical protein [Methyloceanibacter sp. wino2]